MSIETLNVEPSNVEPLNIEGCVALVTGANRGLGRAIAQRLLERGAGKVYATARRPETIDLPGVHPLALDITDPEQIRCAAEIAGDVTLLVNNAGLNTWQPLVDGDLAQIRLEVDTQLFGTLGVIRAFAPILARNGGGAVVNILSAMSWFAYPGDSAYHVAKAAAWAMTNSVRLELAGQQTLVVALHGGLIDTDMSAAVEGDKSSAADVADAALDGVEANTWEVLIDDWSRTVKSSLADDPRRFYRETLGVA